MSGLLELLLGKGADHSLISPRPQVIGPKASTTVEPPPRFAWDERRWRRMTAGDTVEVRGQYRVYDRRHGRWLHFDGYLVQQNSQIAAYIADPPAALRHHQHGSCLQLLKAPWFRLHWRKQPKNLDDALLYMERMLDESVNGSGR